MKLVPVAALLAALLVSGCASVDMASSEASSSAKQFDPPSPNHASVYIYRNSFAEALG